MALCSYCRGIKKGQTLPSNCGNSKESVHTKNIKEHFLKEISTRAYLPIGLHIEMHPRVITPTGQYGNCEKKFSHSHKSTRIHTHTHMKPLTAGFMHLHPHLGFINRSGMERKQHSMNQTEKRVKLRGKMTRDTSNGDRVLNV